MGKQIFCDFCGERMADHNQIAVLCGAKRLISEDEVDSITIIWKERRIYEVHGETRTYNGHKDVDCCWKCFVTEAKKMKEK